MSGSKLIKGGIVALAVGIFAAVALYKSTAVQNDGEVENRPVSAEPSSRVGHAEGYELGETETGKKPPDRATRASDRSGDNAFRLELGIARLEEQSKELQSRNDSDKIPYAADLQFPNNPVKPLYDQFAVEKHSMDELKAGGMGARHPTVVAQQAIMNSMSDDLNKAVARLSDQMDTQLNADKDALRRIRSKP